MSQFPNGIPKPKWLDADPEDWPPGIRVVIDILASVALQELQAEAQRMEREGGTDTAA